LQTEGPEESMSDLSVAFLGPVLLLAWRIITAATRSSSEKANARYSRVRREILGRRLEPASRVRCTVMDWRFDEETMTLVVDPHASSMIYALEQDGTLGDPRGDAHGPARRFLQAVESRRHEMHATSDFREPPPGHACFWIVREDETLTSGDLALDDIKLRVTGWTGAWGSGLATVNEMFESSRIRRERATEARNVAAGPRPV